MANNNEGSSAGSKRRRPSSEDPAPLPDGSPSKLDSTIEAILRKKVRERLDIEKTHSSLLARIKLLEKHAADGTIPSGLRIQRVKAKGQDAETLQAKFDAIIREAEFKLLDAATDSLRVDVEVRREAILERERDIDGTIAQWKTHLSKVKEVTSSQVDNLVEAAGAFVVKLSSDSAVARASKSLQAEITRKENKGREMETNEPFVPDEQSIREIIRQEIHRTQEQPAGSVHQRKVSFSDNPGSRQRKQKSRRQNRSKSPQSRSKGQNQRRQQRGRSKSPKSPRSNSAKRVESPRSSAKNVKGKGSGPAK